MRRRESLAYAFDHRSPVTFVSSEHKLAGVEDEGFALAVGIPFFELFGDFPAGAFRR